MPAYSPIYSIPYVVTAAIFLWLAILEYGHSPWKKYSRHICTAIFILFFGFRGFVGWDWMSYYPMFQQVDVLTHFSWESFGLFFENEDGISVTEPGFVLYMSAIKTLYDNWQFFVLISVIIDWALLDAFFRRYSHNYAFSFLVFFCLRVGLELDLMRNIKAILILLIALKYITERRIIPYLTMCLLGVLFHYSALLFVPLYFFGRWHPSRMIYVAIFVAANIVYILQIPLMSYIVNPISEIIGGGIAVKLHTYADVGTARGFTMGYIFRIVFTTLILWRYHVISKSPNNMLFINMYMITVVVGLAMSDINVIAGRIEGVFSSVTCILYPALIPSLTLESNKRIVFIILTVYLFMKLAASSSNAMYQYENALFGASDYQTRLSTHRGIANQIINERGI